MISSNRFHFVDHPKHKPFDGPSCDGKFGGSPTTSSGFINEPVYDLIEMLPAAGGAPGIHLGDSRTALAVGGRTLADPTQDGIVQIIAWAAGNRNC